MIRRYIKNAGYVLIRILDHSKPSDGVLEFQARIQVPGEKPTGMWCDRDTLDVPKHAAALASYEAANGLCGDGALGPAADVGASSPVPPFSPVPHTGRRRKLTAKGAALEEPAAGGTDDEDGEEGQDDEDLDEAYEDDKAERGRSGGAWSSGDSDDGALLDPSKRKTKRKAGRKSKEPAEQMLVVFVATA